jgi:hypothetical protein
MAENKLITPKTKVLQLIEEYPQLEDVLIAMVPVFAKLRHPLLRRTVARVATLQQAAAVGGMRTEELINRLRGEVGQDAYADGPGTAYCTSRPPWFDAGRVSHELDARTLLAAGEQPVNQVMADFAAMAAGSIYKLSAPFLPAPLIDKGSSLGLEHWLVRENDESFVVYFHKGESAAQAQ